MRASLAAIVLMAAACHHAAPTHVSAAKVAAVTSASASSPFDAGARMHLKDTGACAAITRARAADVAVTVDGPLQNFMITKQGAWGAIVKSAEPAQQWAPNRISLQFAPMSIEFAHATGSDLARGDLEYWVKIEGLSLFDFDGDGEEELIVTGAHSCGSASDGACISVEPDNEIFTIHSGKVARYLSPAVLSIPAGLTQSEIFLKDPTHFDETGHAMRIAEVTDVDGDGRPDLKTDLYYELGVSDGDVSTLTLEGPTFVAHALPDGTFSLTDAVAMKALAASCTGIDTFEKSTSLGLFEVAVCARLRGKTVAEISQRYATRCAQIRAKYKQNMKKSAAGKPALEVDSDAEFACRTEPEEGWSDVNGIPKAITKMLQQTAPLLLTPAADAKP